MRALAALFAFALAFAWGQPRALAQISPSDMLGRIDADKVTFQRAPMVNVPSQITEKVLERQRARYPKFKDSMWYMAYVKENGFTNIVHYDWTGDACFYIVFNDEALKGKSKDVAAFIQSGGSSQSSAAKREKIPMRYCEKVYNFYSDRKD